MLKFPFTQNQREYAILILGDAILLLAGLYLAVLISFPSPIWWTWQPWRLVCVGGILIFSLLLYLYVIGVYNPEFQERPLLLLSLISLTMFLFFLSYSALSYFIVYLRAGKVILLLFIAFSILFIFCWHLLIAKFFPKKPRRVMIIGNNPFLQEIIGIITKKLPKHYEVVASYHRGNINPTIPNIMNVVEDKSVDLIIYSVKSQLIKDVSQQLLNLRFKKIDVYDASTFFQKISGKFPIYHLDHLWLLINSQRDFVLPKFSETLKRAFDVIFVLICLPVALPLMIISGLLIKLTSEGPVFFIHERLGKDEVPFRLIKLRTMIAEAEKVHGPQWAEKDDPRITKVGKIFRKLRLDELPQLINVLKGDMSVVGPRPIRKHFADLLAEEVPYYRLRFLVKPGLTGWAQVKYDYAGSMEGQAEKFQYDLFYLVNQSLLLDLMILLKTLSVMVWGKGT